MKLHRQYFFVLALTLYGCATSPSPGAKFAQPGSALQQCRFIRQVEVISALSDTGESAAVEGLRTQLQADAARIGGNTVIERQTTQNEWGVEMKGDVYACPAGRIVSGS